MGRGGKKPQWMRRLASERIDILLDRAKRTVREAPELARRYVWLARRIGMRYLLPLGARRRRSICTSCHLPMVHGRTARVRVKRGKVVRTCLGCGTITRLPLARERAERHDYQPDNPTVEIGPEGLTEGIIRELERHTATATLISVKLKTTPPAERHDWVLVRALRERLRVSVVDMRGRKLLIKGEVNGNRV
ncbi:MAG: YhbY family RNA-binding protein [Methanopyri archaeon]|nr:YhbY family RNA-binding protein [Methanopyri archaeon]